MRFLKTILFFLFFGGAFSYGQSSIDMPNVITPNKDGVNDVFSVTSTGFDELECTIYNRYGEVVYRFFGINGTWDGYTHAGILVSPGVYFVFLEVSASDGSSETRQGALHVQY